MNFDFTEDQGMLRETAQKLFAEAPQDHWGRLADMGLLAAPFAEEDGGLGLGAVESMIIGEAAGRARAISPYGPALVLCGTALRLAPEPTSTVIADVALGITRLAWAHDEQGAPATASRRSEAFFEDGSWRLTGAKVRVAWTGGADAILVTAVAGGEPIILLVDPHASGVSRRDYSLFDRSTASDLSFENVSVAAHCVVAKGRSAESLMVRAREHYLAYRAAEAVGLMQASLDDTLEHLRTRRQFGQALAEFQALRHKAAEMLVALEQARSMAMLAALSVEDPDPRVREMAIKQVRTVVGASCRLVGQTAVQLHGGIGVTEEHPVGRAFRSLTLIDLEMELG